MDEMLNLFITDGSNDHYLIVNFTMSGQQSNDELNNFVKDVYECAMIAKKRAGLIRYDDEEMQENLIRAYDNLNKKIVENIGIIDKYNFGTIKHTRYASKSATADFGPAQWNGGYAIPSGYKATSLFVLAMSLYDDHLLKAILKKIPNGHIPETLEKTFLRSVNNSPFNETNLTLVKFISRNSKNRYDTSIMFDYLKVNRNIDIILELIDIIGNINDVDENGSNIPMRICDIPEDDYEMEDDSYADPSRMIRKLFERKIDGKLFMEDNDFLSGEERKENITSSISIAIRRRNYKIATFLVRELSTNIFGWYLYKRIFMVEMIGAMVV